MSRGAVPALVAILILAPACAQDQPAADPEPTSTPAPAATGEVDPTLVPFYTQRLEWEGCHDEFQCTSVEVPLDYAAPGGDIIELAVLRRPATGDDRIGSLLVNPGGPGSSGVAYARGNVVNDDVAERFDIV
ncbi:MAG TPA: hypothetical protein VIQ02_18335, partial [Jiangellaceae bacterium]